MLEYLLLPLPRPKNDQSEPQGDDTEVSKAQSTVGNNISGFCSGRIDRIVERAVTNADDRLFSSQAKIDEDIAAQNAVLPLLGEQHLVATNPTLQHLARIFPTGLQPHEWNLPIGCALDATGWPNRTGGRG